MTRFFAATMVAAAALVTVSSTASALDRRVEIVNATGLTMMEFYASNVRTDSWEEDIFGPDVLYSGYSIIVNIDDGRGYCRFDMKGVFENGAEQVFSDVNVCEVTRVTFQ
jgi:hypothetical protein